MSAAANDAARFRANIDNLTDLWRALGARVHGQEGDAPLYESESWPGRLWFDVADGPVPRRRVRLLAAAGASPRALVVPVWLPGGDFASSSDLVAHGFERTFEQTVMSADLASIRGDTLRSSRLEFDEGGVDVAAWTDVAARSFGYAIDARAVARLAASSDAHLLVAWREGVAVGTGLLFASGSIAGIHMVGVTPEARRAGIAGAIMSRLLEEARARGLDQAALQASVMGEGLYRKLGFVSLGRVENLRLAGRSEASR